jgi:hypothetical protein
VTEALLSSPHPFCIVTSKAGHRVSALMRAAMNIDLAPDDPRLYSSLLPPGGSLGLQLMEGARVGQLGVMCSLCTCLAAQLCCQPSTSVDDILLSFMCCCW